MESGCVSRCADLQRHAAGCALCRIVCLVLPLLLLLLLSPLQLMPLPRLLLLMTTMMTMSNILLQLLFRSLTHHWLHRARTQHVLCQSKSPCGSRAALKSPRRSPTPQQQHIQGSSNSTIATAARQLLLQQLATFNLISCQPPAQLDNDRYHWPFLTFSDKVPVRPHPAPMSSIARRFAQSRF